MGSLRAIIVSAVAAGAALLPAACEHGKSVSPNAYFVLYQLSGTESVTFDSLRYEDAQGSLVTVAAPHSGWSVALGAQAGSYVQAAAWGVSTAGSQSAKLRVTWGISGVSAAVDSGATAISAPGQFMLSIPRRQI